MDPRRARERCRGLIAAGGLVVMLLLAGCTTPPAAPDRLVFGVPPGTEVPLDGRLLTNVTFTVSGRESLQVHAPEDCLRVEVIARAAVPVALDDLDPPVCRDEPRTHTIRPGESRTWGPFRLAPVEFHAGEQPLFAPGEYEIVARFAGTASRESEGSTWIRVAPPEELPRIAIVPEHPHWPAGEATRIEARFNNTGDREFTYSSSDGCNDIEVYVVDARGPGNDTRLWPADGPYGCPDVMSDFTVAPGEEVHVEVVWDGGRDGAGPPFVPAGAWFVTARFSGSGHAWPTHTSEVVLILHDEAPP